MSDIIDDANDRAERDLGLAITAARQLASAPTRPLPTECDNGCGSAPRERSRYCSDECRLDHSERLERVRRQRAR